MSLLSCVTCTDCKICHPPYYLFHTGAYLSLQEQEKNSEAHWKVFQPEVSVIIVQLVNVSRVGGTYSLLNRNSIQLWNSLCVAGHRGLGGGIQMIPLAELQGREMPLCAGHTRPHLSVLLRYNLLAFESIKIISKFCQCSSKAHSSVIKI